MKLLHRFSYFLAVALLICLANSSFAQNKQSKADSKPKAVTVGGSNESDPWNRVIPELQFDNVPLKDVVDYISEHVPEINFVIQAPVSTIPVSLKLRSVKLDDIFTALDICTKQTAGGGIDPSTGLPTPGNTLEIKKLSDRMVSFVAYEGSMRGMATMTVCRAFSLSRYLAGKADKEVNEAMTEIEDALQTAWKMLQVSDPANAKLVRPQLNLHRATKLLIVVGQPQQVQVVEEVINQLESGAGAEEAAAARAMNSRYGVPGGIGAPGGFPGQPGGLAPAAGTGVPGISPSPTQPNRGR